MKRNELDKLLEEKLAKFFGQMVGHVDARIDAQTQELHDRFDRLETMVDALADRVVTDEIERAALSHQLHRHEGWIGQLAKHTNTKMAPKPES